MFNLTIDDAPASNAKLELKNENRTLWTGITNDLGLAEVPAKFVNVFQLAHPYVPPNPSIIIENNMSTPLTLSWTHGENSGDVSLTIDSNNKVYDVAYTPPGPLPYLGLLLLIIVLVVLVKNKWI